MSTASIVRRTLGVSRAGLSERGASGGFLASAAGLGSAAHGHGLTVVEAKRTVPVRRLGRAQAAAYFV